MIEFLFACTSLASQIGCWVKRKRSFVEMKIDTNNQQYIMSSDKDQKEQKEIELKLLTPVEQMEITPAVPVEPVTWNEFTYKEQANAPKISLSGLSMLLLSPILLVAHLRISHAMQIPTIQFSFISILFAFLINYTAIIRRYELRPFLPQEVYDNKLKWICVGGLVALIISIFWGWNGSGGIIFAMGWEYLRGNRMGNYGYLLALIIVGCLAMQDNFKWVKLIHFIPGILLGSVSSTLFTLRDSSMYAIAHQFLLLTAVTLPIFFPISHIIVPTIFQWAFMLISGVTILFTTVLTIKLFQTETTSIVMAVTSTILMIGLCPFNDAFDIVGAVLAIVGVIVILKKHCFDVDF